VTDPKESAMHTIPAPHIAPARFAAVIDIENLLILDAHALTTHRQARNIVGQISNRMAEMPVRVASGRRVATTFMPMLAAQGWGFTLVDTTPDAADNALLSAAREFIAAGVTDLVVASGDHAFAELADGVRLHVISHGDHLSRRLAAVATTVTRLLRPAADFDLAA
jgi:hypothetical protein